MPTLGCIIIFQISVPITGAIIIGKMSVGVKIFASRDSRLSSMAMPRPNSSSTPVVHSA